MSLSQRIVVPATRRESKIFPINIRQLHVARIEDFGVFRRLTLSGEQLSGFTTQDGIVVPPLRSEGFDDHVKVIVPETRDQAVAPPRQVEGHLDWSGSSPGKDYTPVRVDHQAAEIDLEFVRHDGGVASDWAERVTVGDPAWIAGPKSSSLAPEGFDWLLIGGDETALPAISRLLAELPAYTAAQVFIEVDGTADERALGQPEGVEVTWLHRDGAAAGSTTLLEDAITSAPWWPGDVYVWLAGESQSLRPLRAHLKNDRALPRDCLEVTGYWRRPKTRPVEVSEPAQATPALDNVMSADEGWQRLDMLLDVSTPAAVRAAIEVGLFRQLELSPADPASLARALGLELAPLRALARLLAAHDLVAVDPQDPAVTGDGLLRLGPLGELLVEDELPLGPSQPGAFLDLDPVDTVSLLRTGVTSRTGAAATAEQVAELLEDVRWAAPSVVSHYDWAEHRGVLVVGDTAALMIKAFADVLPALPVREVPWSDLRPHHDEAVLVCGILDRIEQSRASELLGRVAEAARASHSPVLVAERTLPGDEGIHDHDALLDLQLRAAFDGGLLSAPEHLARFQSVGLQTETPAGVELGWDMRMWVLTAG